MTYITNHIKFPPIDGDTSSIDIFIISDKYQRVVTSNNDTGVIELDSTYIMEIINGDKFFPNLEGEQLFDPYIYYML